MNIYKSIVVLSLSIFVHPWLNGFAFAADSTPVVDKAFDAAAKALEKSKEEVQRLKDGWDRARLETTLYDQRAKRAYQRWVKATKKVKEKAGAQKEKAQLELQLAIEKRKLAWSQWQSAQLRMLADETLVRAFDQEKDTSAIKEKIKQIEEKLKGGRPSTVNSSRPSKSSRQSAADSPQ